MKYGVLILITIILASCNSKDEASDNSAKQENSSLPYMGHYDEVLKEVDGEEQVVKEYNPLRNFTLTDQYGEQFQSKDLRGKMMVVDFFFTRCPGICPKMTNQMKRAQTVTEDLKKDVQFVSVSIDDQDSSSVLRAYIEKFGINDENWSFVHGNEKYIRGVGYDYKVNVFESDVPADSGFIHSEHFLLLDGLGYLRGMYNGTETEEVDKLIEDIRTLHKEKEQWQK